MAACLLFSTVCVRSETSNETTTVSSSADEAGKSGGWFQNIKNTWYSKQWDIFLPFWEWHNRSVYGKDAQQFNEAAWGLGIGKSYIDAKGNRYSLFVMGFQDSYKKIEPMAGLMWQKLWRDSSDTWRVSLGAMGGVTARDDTNYSPLPVLLPVVGFEYKRLSLECTYVPKVSALDIRGNVLFVWARWRL